MSAVARAGSRPAMGGSAQEGSSLGLYALVAVLANRSTAVGGRHELRVALSFGSPHHTQRTRSADRILEQLEDHLVSDLELVEHRPVGDVATMKEDLTVVAQSDESVPLADQELRDSTDGAAAVRLVPHPCGPRGPGCRLTPGVEVVGAHRDGVYQRGSDRRRRESPPPS